MARLGFFLNYDPHYRESIYNKIDSRWECKWLFAENENGVAHIGLDKFQSARRCLYKRLAGGIIYQSGWYALLSDRKVDSIVFTGELNNLSNWFLMLLRPIVARRKKIYSWSHGWYGRETGIKKFIKKLSVSLCDGCFVYGDRAKTIAEQQGNDPSKIFTIHNSLNYDAQLAVRQSLSKTDIYSCHFNNDDPTIIFIGRITVAKKLGMILEAMAILREKDIKVNCVLIGGGDKGQLQELARELGLDNRVWFYGPCYDEVTNAELIYNASVCVSPGEVGLTAIHSLMFGTPVIAHSDLAHQGPEAEAIITDTTGSFFTKDSVSDLTECIAKWVGNNDDDREIVRESCYREIDTRWNPDFQMKVLESVFGN